jgi:DUF438 domain-containing protein
MRRRVMSEGRGSKETLRGLIEALKAGASPDELKQRFKDAFGAAGPAELPQIEEQLVAEGVPQEDVQRLCELHLEAMKDSPEAKQSLAPEGHPINTLLQEHEAILAFAEELRDLTDDLADATSPEEVTAQMERIRPIEEQMKDSESHYLREENVLFPYLEKHGITQPPAVMWMEHDEIRQTKKGLYQAIEEHPGTVARGPALDLKDVAEALADLLASHFYKESNILFPAALRVIGEAEWKEIGRQFYELGYCSFTPEAAKTPPEAEEGGTAEAGADGEVTFETGSLSREALGAILNTLPVDITYVDKDDKVRYFSKPETRIFERMPAIIGRAVQQCHPEKSVHVVNDILDSFRSGREDVADFWINFQGRFVQIRYFAVRDAKGDYLGCLEVTQDVTDIRALEGERRLLSWESEHGTSPASHPQS